MAKGNLGACLAVILPFEGGWADHPKDPGGATMKGITIAVYRRYKPGATKADLRGISDAEVEAIYRNGYWEPILGEQLPVGADLTVLDYGINSGPSRSVKDAQRVSGAEVDGRMGPKTLAAIAAMPSRAFIKAHCAARLGFVQSLKIWNTFGKGWSRRIAGIEAKGLSWVSSKAELEKDAKDAAGKAVGQGAGAGGAVGTGTVDQVNGISGLPIGLIIAAVVIVAGILIIRTIINAQRAQALSAAAKEA